MAGRDWRDPFAEDPAADERERRRAEREARRRERSQRRSESQTAVGKRVKDLLQRDGEPSDDGSVEETEPLAARPEPRISESTATPMPAADQPSLPFPPQIARSGA